MRRFYAFLAVMASLLFIIIISASSSGAALIRGRGYTGAPSAGGGDEGYCSQCHGGGNYGEPIVDVTISEILGGPAVAEYTPGETYFVSVNVSAMNDPEAYGFQSVFLSDDGTLFRPQAGTLQNPEIGTQVTTLGSRFYAEHEAASASGTFGFEWEAPAANTGEVTVYVVGNAVNGANGSGGDNGSTMSTIVQLSESGALPLDLLSFTGREVKGQIELNWATEGEEDFSHFSVDRKTHGDWVEIALLDGRANGGGATYEYIDRAPEPGDNTYRLRMNDLDGSIAYSHLVTLATDQPDISISPNPAVDFITVSGALGEAASVRLIGADGTVVHQGELNGQLDVRAFPAGIYYVEVITDGQRLVERFIKR